MTTIAISDTEIAWDSQLTVGDRRIVYPKMKVEVLDGRIYAIAGSGPAVEWMARWYLNGCPQGDDVIPPGDWGMVVFELDANMDCGFRMVLVEADAPYPEFISPPYCIGSGGDLALGAMRMGAPPIDAVQIAAIDDTQTCGPFYELNIYDTLGLEAPEPVETALPKRKRRT